MTIRLHRGREGQMSRIVLERIARDIEEVFTAQAAELRELADAISDFAMRARTNGQRTFGYYTDGSMAGSMERALKVTDHLIAEARKSA